VNIREWRQFNTERGKFGIGIGGRQSGTAIAVREWNKVSALCKKKRNFDQSNEFTV